MHEIEPKSGKHVCEHAAAVTDPPESAAAPPEPVEPRISYVIARLERAVRAQINERLGPQGLTTLQYTTLSVLGSRGQPLSNAQLARRAYMTPQAMIEVLNALEEKGLIEEIRIRTTVASTRRASRTRDAGSWRSATPPSRRWRRRCSRGSIQRSASSSRSGSRSASAPCTRGCRPRVSGGGHQPRRRSLEKNQVA